MSPLIWTCFKSESEWVKPSPCECKSKCKPRSAWVCVIAKLPTFVCTSLRQFFFFCSISACSLVALDIYCTAASMEISPGLHSEVIFVKNLHCWKGNWIQLDLTWRMMKCWFAQVLLKWIIYKYCIYCRPIEDQILESTDCALLFMLISSCQILTPVEFSADHYTWR